MAESVSKEIEKKKPKQEESLQNPLDKFFKRVFLNKKMVEELMVYLVGKSWVKKLDFTTLELVNKTYIKKNKKERENDVLWKLKYDGKDVQIHIIIEIQSSNDNRMPIRFLDYIASFYENSYQNLKKDEKIVPIIPVLLYIASEKWNAKVKMQDLIDIPDKTLKKYIPHFEYIPIIMDKISKKELQKADSYLTKLLSINKSEDLNELKYLMSQLLKTIFKFKDEAERKKFREILVDYLETVMTKKYDYDHMMEKLYEVGEEEDMFFMNLDHIFEKEEKEKEELKREIKKAEREIEKEREKAQKEIATEKKEKMKILSFLKNSIKTFFGLGLTKEDISKNLNISIEE
ncbi:Rpn family recombination-promoting nuclease/putative transposase, partial [bacterium]|nr:Rpn family recombination-promoting nuclease/putative transposase [bacterium]